MKIVVAVSGASGSIYAKSLLTILSSMGDVEVSVVVSDTARSIWKDEIGSDFSHFIGGWNGRFELLDNNSYYALTASGSQAADAMVVIPCSMGELGRIASGVSVDLIGRVADVQLKERKKLILVTREAPLNLIHIQNMEKVTQAGGVIFPASPPMYNNPSSIEEMAYMFAERILSFLGLSLGDNRYRWTK